MNGNSGDICNRINNMLETPKKMCEFVANLVSGIVGK